MVLENGENIVISGISGRFPMSGNVEEFSKNLYDKVDMVAEAELGELETLYSKMPKRRGVIDNLNKFDAAYFHVNTKQAEKMSPESRILLELATEAIFDAGINPVSFRGSNTAECLAQSAYDAMYTGLYTESSDDLLNFLGSSSVIAVNRVSFCLGLRGTSIVVDAACAASFVALHSAINWIRQGESDAVLVLTTNVQSHPVITKMFAKLDVLNPDGCSRPFDENANGYVRSDTMAAILLQKRRDAKRVYANIEEVVCNHDGFKAEGITHPSGESQSELFHSLYKKIGIDPLNVHFVEAHGTGTVVGDPEECQAIDNVFCKNRKGPLLIGSTKSNMGHPEGASGITSLMKAIFTFETGLIPPNINFTKVRRDIPSLTSGRLKVCTEPTQLKGSFIAINVFGFGGVNGHALFRREEARIKTIIDHKLPTLVCWSGRTEEAVRNIFAKLKSIPIDVQFNALLHNIQKISIKENVHRGYILLKTSETDALPQCVEEKVSPYEEVKRPIVWASSGLGSQYPKMAQNLMRIPLFANSIMKCHQVLQQFGMDLVSRITSDESALDSITHSFVGITAIQIAIVDLLKSLEVPVDFYIGHSMGEICCAYADGALSLEQTILSSYYRGKCSVEEKLVEGAMAAIGLGYNDIKDNLPPNIEVACHNSSSSCTISGPKNDILKYVDELRSKDIFAKAVKCGNIAFHAKYIADVAPKLLEKLKSVIPNKIERSPKWLSTSNTIDQWHTDLARFASAEYFVNNYLNPVYFEETCKLIPENAIIIEIAPHRLLQSIFKKMLPNAIYVPLTFSQYGDQIEFLSMALGKLYMSGVSVQIDRLYPAVDFPVSLGTPKISPLIKWNHEKNWPTWHDKSEDKARQIQKTVYVNTSDENYKFIGGHCINGRCIIPAASILNFVKDTAIAAGAQAFGLNHIQSLVFENVRFLSTTELKPNTDVKISILIQLENGKFEVREGPTAIASGIIHCANDASPIRDAATFYKEFNLPILNSSDVYKEFRLRGCNYTEEFKSIDRTRMDGCYAQIKCKKNNWTTIMDAMIQLILLSMDTRSLQLPAEIRRVRINVNHHLNQFKSTDDDISDDENLFDVYHSSELSTIVCAGIEMNGVIFSHVERMEPDGLEVLQTYQFVPLMDAVFPYFSDAANVCIALALEKILMDKVTLVEFLASESKASIDCFYEVFRKTPAVFADLTLLHDGNTDISLKNKESIRCESSSLEEYSDCTFIVLNRCTQNDKLSETAMQSLSKDGFLIVIDDLHTNMTVPNGFTVISQIECPEAIFTLMQHTPIDYIDDFTVIKIDSGDEHFTWLQKLQETNPSDNVLLVAQHDKTPGLLGLINCLRLELETKRLRCIIIEDENAPSFDVNVPLYNKQLALQLPVNIYRDAKWGTYRHLDLRSETLRCDSENRLIVNVEQVHDLRALHWVHGTELSPSNESVRVQYAALNFCDRLIATGGLPSHTVIENRFDECRPLLGFECAGVTGSQKRVMCFALRGGLLSTHICYESADILLEVPDNMSLRDAATIPFAYFTVYSSFFLKNKIESGQSILINADCAFAGLAAIHVTLAYGLNVFAAVSTQQQKEFLLNNFPQLKEENVGHSSDYSFEELVINETNNKGTDFVFNSLPAEQMASIRCLKRGGTFLELGKFDVDKNAEVAINALRRGITIQPVVVEHIIKNLHQRNNVIALMEKDLKCGIIQPLPSTIFEADDIENAFKFLMIGQHAGKVLVQIRSEENSERSLLPITVWPRALFKPELVYILIGGLGGFGLELADWMTMRGARKFVLCSRQGVTDQYQEYRIKKWESYGCTIVINTSNLTTFNCCEELLSRTTGYGEIGGIFNLAVVLRDGILANQTASTFSESFAPKVWITAHLDCLSRTMCPKLEYFVCFSSFTCGYGNPGQSNYGMGNSIMERIMEKRRRCNLPGKSIQWSAIGDVGIVENLHSVNIRVELHGALPKSMNSCLLALDKLLTHSAPTVACTQVAIQKKTINKLDLTESLCQILCVDRKTLTLNASLTHIGMDSLMAVEVRHMLQRDFNIVLDNNAIKNVTIEELNSIFKPN